MNKKILFLSLIFPLFLSSSIANAQKLYTAYNIWYTNPAKVQAINYKKGTILPAGTEVKNVHITKGRRPAIKFTVVPGGVEFTINYNKKYHGKVSIQKFRNRMFTYKNFSEQTAGLNEMELNAIRSGKPMPGMSKKAVAICMGLPPEHKTPTLRRNTWVYWRSKMRKAVISFGEDGLSLPKGVKPARLEEPRLTLNKKSKSGGTPVVAPAMPGVNTGMTADVTAPQINITEPVVTRGMRIANKKLTVRGKATDASGVFEVLINGAEAQLAADGSFWAEVLLAVGENQIHVRARDVKNNVADETFTIVRAGTEPSVPVAANQVSLGNGQYYALIIAVEDYISNSINDLDQPVKDARHLRDVLTTQYIFEPQNVVLLENATREQIIENFDRLSKKIRKQDNLLIFYAGHGYWDEKFQQGYWLPANSERDSRTEWISNSTIVDFIRGIETTHTLLITDACFSGGIFKTRKAFSDAPPAITELYKLPSRKAMTSGTLKEVPDKSVFVEYLTKRLNTNNQKYMTSEQLFTSFRTAVINNSPVNQIPQFGEIRQSGDEGGDFVFIKR